MCHTRYRASEQTRLPRLFQIPCIAGFFLSAVVLRGGGYNEVAKQGWYRLTKDPCTSSHFFGSLCEGFFVYTKAEMPESGQRGLSVEQAAQAYGGSNPSLSTNWRTNQAKPTHLTKPAWYSRESKSFKHFPWWGSSHQELNFSLSSFWLAWIHANRRTNE